MFSKNHRLMYREFPAWVRMAFAVTALVFIWFIGYESLIAVDPQPDNSHIDKLIHLVAYGALGIVTLPALSRISPVLICIGLGLYGAGIEIAQGIMGIGRSADLLDGIANLAGAFLALLAWATFSKLAKIQTANA